ncbi:MAG: type IV pilin protein [Janthinobacterium lividum]
MTRYARGFSLIELMICLAISAAIGAYAWPTYQEYSRRGHRATLVATLLQAANYLEQASRETGRGPNEGACPTLPAGLARSPPHGAIDYRITVNCERSSRGGDYVLQAHPVAGARMAGDTRCGIFELDARGRRRNLLGARRDQQGAQDKRDDRDIAYCWEGR